MATLLWILISISIAQDFVTDDIGTCNNSYNIFKNTFASSDSKRDCQNAYKIFPYIRDEEANKFHDGECAYQCKLELDNTCFKIHAPQTWQHDEGILPIHIAEKKMSFKWEMVLNENYPYDYDAFLDFNTAFWVKSLDDYILHWQTNEKQDDDLKFEYIGIEWKLDWNLEINDDEYMENKIFYSILIHSPSSQWNYEFISYNKPKQKLYKTIKWIYSDLPRCTFKLQEPWNRFDSAQIVPIRISKPTTSIDLIYDFYINVMEGQLINYKISNIPMEQIEKQSKMSIDSETMFIALTNTLIELQFIERPHYYTTPDFTLKTFENILIETHETIVTSPYCGQDRWFDNHYAYSTWTINGLLDRILNRLNQRGITYRVSKSPYEHSSIYAQKNLDYYGYDCGYGMTIVEPTGQTFQVGGYIENPYIQKFATVGDPQWCYQECPGGLMEGQIDPNKLWYEPGDEDYVAPDNVNIVDNKDNDYYDDDDGDYDMLRNNKVFSKVVVIEDDMMDLEIIEPYDDDEEIIFTENSWYWLTGIGMLIPAAICILISISYKYANDEINEYNNKDSKNEYSPLIELTERA